MDDELLSDAQRTGSLILSATAIALALRDRPNAEQDIDDLLTSVRKQFGSRFAPTADEDVDGHNSPSAFAAEVEKTISDGLVMAKKLISSLPQ